MLYLSCKEFDMQISIQGVLKVNYELTVDEDAFNDACGDAGLDPVNYKSFTKDEWTELNSHIVQVVFDNEQELDYTEIHSQKSIMVDTVTIDDPKQMTTVYYNQDRITDSIEIM